MHVRYLQHQGQGTLQRLPMPLSRTVGSFQSNRRSIDALSSYCRSMDPLSSVNDDENELESVPLPIQTFLWRQTNPFLGAKIGKLHEASCVTFERVVVQNILHGLSPSLSDAINSVSRWRFVRATFPHIVQCCASLLSEAIGRDGTPMSGSLVKMLYILHWLLLDSANECYDVESRKSLTESTDFSAHAIRQYAFSISSIQLFVYMITPLLNAINEKDLASNFRLESGIKIWQSLWQYRQPEVLCFCAPVKQRRTHFPFITIAKKPQPTSAVQGIYLGDADETMTRRLSNVPAQIANLQPYTDVPPPKPPRPHLTVLSSLKKQKDEEAEVVTAQAIATLGINRQQQQQPQILTMKKQTNNLEMGRSSSIVRSVSDYHTSDVPRIFTKSRTTIFDEKSPSLCKGMAEIDDALNFTDDKSLSNAIIDDVELSEEKAPLVILQEICSGISADFENISHSGCEIICESCHSVVYHDGTARNTCKCDHGHPVASRFKIIPTISTSHSDVTLPEFKQSTDKLRKEETISTLNGATVIRAVQKENTLTESMKVFDPLENSSQGSDTIHEQSFIDPQEATYMDVAVIRCLLIKHWAEDGVYWAIKYLLHRLFEIKMYRNSQTITHRSRANSVPSIPHLKLFSARMVQNNRKALGKIQYCPPAWEDLQLGDVAKKLEKSKHDRRQQKVSSIRSGKKRCSLSSDSLLQVSALSKQSGMMTSGSSFKSHTSRGHLERNRSDPSATNSSDGRSTRDTRSGSVIGLPKQTTSELNTRHFFPEALGSTNFIEQNGQISFTVLLKAINFAIERRFSVRIYELALNVCESLLEMPETELQSFFIDCINIVLRTYLWLGCPHGCNDGLRSQQGDFLRVKARTILAIISHINPEIFRNLLISHIEEYNAQMLIDTLHSVTGFCRCGVTAGIYRTRSGSSPRRRTIVSESSLPSYENNFNESLKGIEGTVIKVILKPVVSKLMNAMNELLQPENMSLYQDVRLFVSFIQEQHGNSFRRVGLSALLDGRPSENQNQFLDVGTSQLYSSRRTSLLCPLPEIFLSERNAKFASNDDNEIEVKSDNNSEDESIRSSISGTATLVHTRESASLRRGLFKRREKVSNTDDSDLDSSPSTPRNVQTSDEVTNTSLSASPLLPLNVVKKRSGGKLHFALNLLKSVRADNNDDIGSDVEINDDDKSQNGTLTHEERRSKGLTVQKSPSSKIFIAHQKSIESVDDKQELLHPRRASLANLNLPSRKFVNLRGIQEGVRRFSFFLETCRPGSYPDAPLLAALLDLKSPVLARASLLLECALFVHRCNKGDWPEWIRSNNACQLSAFVVGNTFGNRGTPSATRRMHMMQRAAARCFYDWGCQLGERIYKIMETNGAMLNKTPSKKTELNRRELVIHDNLEDFFDEGIVNDESGECCPPAILFLACLLLNEITAFLRETFQTIPRSRGNKGASAGTSNFDKLMSSRRWSILSNTFSSQQQQPTASSIQSITDVNLSIHQGDRRISLSTNEENSSRSSHEHTEEIVQQSDKKDANGDRLTRCTDGERLISLSDQHLACKKRSCYERKSGENCPQVRRSHTLTVPTHSMVITAIVSKSARRLAQGRQRLFKYGSSSNTSSQPLETNEKIHRSTKNLKSPRNAQIDDGKDGIGEITLPTTILPAIGGGWMEGIRDGLKQSNETVISPENGSKISMITPMPSSTQDSISRPTVTCYQQSQTNFDEDEELMFRNFPWLKMIIKMANSFNLSCNHERFCHPWCFERVYRQCYRLTEALRKVYGEDLPPLGHLDKRKAMTDAWINRHENVKKATQRLSGLFGARRENAAVRQGAILDKPPMALRSLLIEKLTEMEENREGRMGKNNFQDSDDLIEVSQAQRYLPPSPMLSYISTQMLCITHAPFSTLLKSCLVLRNEHYRETMDICWHLLIHRDKHIVTSAASLFIVSSVRSPEGTVNVIRNSLLSDDPNIRTEGLRRFHALWRNRFHVWLKMEDGAQLVFKVPPPGIDFTLPSPPVGQSHISIVDPPWMPHTKTKVEELCLKEEEQATSQTIMTMTRTRRKQKQEMVRRAAHEANERESSLRQKFPFRATAIVQQAAYEPALFHHQTQQAVADSAGEECDLHPSSSRQQMPVAQPLFPSSLLSVVPMIIEMLDDVQLDSSGKSVSDTVQKIIWSCIVEDPALFLRHFLEKLTNRERQEHLISLLRKLILRFQPLPCQTAYTLMNYFFGFVMHYVRSPCDGSDQAIAMALSIIWLIIPNVHGLYFKDLKQTLKKEQCDQALMITANVPSAKKIIIHGPDSASGGIPSQFPIHEETQFQQLLKDSLEFFNIPESDNHYYFLIDTKTNLVHNPSSYVRDFYFFHRSLYPQLTLVKLNPDEAHLRMRQIAFTHKLIEMGKVLLTHNALAHSPENVIPQRIFFLHDEFTHLPSFPRKSLETCFGMYNGALGRELYSIDSMHKFVWTLLMSDMFARMENAFMFGDLHLFINVINGVTLLHCENVTILRRCMATYLSMAIHFSTLFTNQGFFLIMPTILRCYSQRQTNPLLCRTIEYVCKQFYILHRKPFLLQMAGAVANILDTTDSNFDVNPMKVKAKYWFNLLHSMEDMNDMADPIDILDLVNETKPLKALDLCYRDDPNTFSLLTDALASAVTVCAFAPESRRCYQMLLVMQATIPYFLEQIEQDTVKQGNSMVAVKHEISIYTTLCVEMKALVNCCDILARGPTRTFDIVNSVSDRGKSFIADSPQFFDPPTLVEDETKMHYSSVKDKKSAVGADAMDNSEGQREIFRRPRDALLVLAATFIEKAKSRLKELTKLASNIEHIKIPELFDHKCYVKLNEIALALLKIAPYDLSTIACLGLQKYFSVILLITDWSVESNRPTLNFVLRRLDKTIQKIGKKIVFRRRTNWTALTNWLNGLHQTLVAYPYIAHSHPLKSTTLMCLRIMIGDPLNDDLFTQSNTAFSTVLHGACPPQPFCNAVLKLASFLMQALGQAAFSLEYLCSSEGIGTTAERLEVVLCHVLIPLFLRAAIVKNDKPQFQTKDLIFCLNLMQNAINPPLARQSVAPLMSSNLASTLMRGSNPHGSTVMDVTGRQGSVSVTERGHSATVTTHRIVRETVCQAIFLALKVMIIAFEKQMALLWPRVFKVIRDLLGKKIGGTALYSFIDFMVDVNLPISLIILPFLQSKIAQKVLTEQEAAWQAEFKERVQMLGGASGTKIRGYGSLLAELSQELQMMKEDFSIRAFEIARSHTPTITELHSDSGSSQSTVGHRHSNARSNANEVRRLSTTTITKLNRIASSVHHKEAVPERTIVEGTEDDNSHMISSSITATKSHFIGSEKRTVVELHDLPLFSKYRKSPNIEKRQSKLETLVLPLKLEEPRSTSSESEKPKVVSFTTPAEHRRDSSGDEDFVDRITARHHYV